MLRLCCRRARRSVRLPYRRTFNTSTGNRKNNNQDIPKTALNSSNNIQPSASEPPPPALIPIPQSPNPNRTFFLVLSTTVVSGMLGSYVLTHSDDVSSAAQSAKREFEIAVEKSNASLNKIVHRMRQTGTAASVLWQSLRSLMSSANHEVRVGFELRVAALLADIAAASESRRAAIVAAGGGAVIDWLLDTVAVASADNLGTQAESARALAYLIADPNVCEAVLARPHAVPNLLRFIFSAHPRKNQKRRSSFDLSDALKGRSMLVAAIMDVVTSNCESADNLLFKPLLPKDAEVRDISAAIEVIEGGIHWDESPEDEGDDNGGNGVKGIGIKILEGTTVLGLSRINRLVENENSDVNDAVTVQSMPQSHLFNNTYDHPPAHAKLSSVVVPGLWDDLHSEHVAVPFAAWALANWAMASQDNRSHIHELDQDGHAIMTALVAPERSVKWHGSLVARLLLEDQNLSLNESVSDWASSLLSTAFQASKVQDAPLARVALSAFLVAIEKSPDAREVVLDKGLHLIRESVKQSQKHKSVQELLAKALELICSDELHISLEESQKWSGILLPWIFGQHSSDTIRNSAINILAHILEDYGPSSIPISQGWLTIMLTDILSLKKTALTTGNTQPESDKVKTQIDQANIVSGTQIASQLSSAVVNLAGKQIGTSVESEDAFPLLDLLSLDQFSVAFKNFKKDKNPKINAADAALATLKGLKALTEVCVEDSLCQNKIVDFGGLCLLRRLLLEDDYEQLAAIEAYDASRALQAQERGSLAPGESSASNNNDSSSLRVPPTAHMRRHAARLLTVLSTLPKVQKAIFTDDVWRKWLEDCSKGIVPGSSDLKIQSYARATLLNVLCNYRPSENSVNNETVDKKNSHCVHYADRIYLINPERPHWKCLDTTMPYLSSTSPSGNGDTVPNAVENLSEDVNEDNSSTPTSTSDTCQGSDVPPLDIVFVHGLRGGAFKSWRLSEDKSSTKSGLVEKIDEEAGKKGTFWPGEWLPVDFPDARVFSLKYKTNLTQWSGASLPLLEVSSMLLEKLVAAGIGDRPVVFVTHSMGGLVVKEMLYQAKAENKDNFVKNTIGIVFYSCPHFGSKLADMPWRMGLVLRPAPTIGELRSGSPRLLELNNFIGELHEKGMLDVLSFGETKLTPIVEGYGGYAYRREIVPIASAFPGYGQLVVLDSTDHVNSCKPLSRDDPSYKETLDFLQKLKAQKLQCK
ncbi:OLC1v1016766C1 [Oldenlandia corymbosa var. corymbosa]|uniref:OLC1v1016766C1 n=1 Tax=Oldenlandia corymbosa var. corymbosa TaxID=529605 RepID=A0AAV1E7X3_OLDCO|nr:OLC1v1016766C1 [Oldenlandia corymbosa var. corymbosa]